LEPDPISDKIVFVKFQTGLIKISRADLLNVIIHLRIAFLNVIKTFVVYIRVHRTESRNEVPAYDFSLVVVTLLDAVLFVRWR
jgi:hypothetical protein